MNATQVYNVRVHVNGSSKYGSITLHWEDDAYRYRIRVAPTAVGLGVDQIIFKNRKVASLNARTVRLDAELPKWQAFLRELDTLYDTSRLIERAFERRTQQRRDREAARARQDAYRVSAAAVFADVPYPAEFLQGDRRIKILVDVIDRLANALAAALGDNEPLAPASVAAIHAANTAKWDILR